MQFGEFSAFSLIVLVDRKYEQVRHNRKNRADCQHKNRQAGQKDDASPIARKVNIIETEETGIGIKRSSG